MEEFAVSRRHSVLLWGVNLCAISASTLSYIYFSYYIYAHTASLILSQVVLFAPMVLPVILVAPIYRLADYLAPRTLLWSANLLSLGCAAATYKILPHHVEVVVLGAVVIGTLDALQRVGRIVAIKCYFPGAQIASSVPLTLTAQFIAGGLAGISLLLFKANMTPGLALLITVSLFSIAALAAYLLPAPTKPPITVQVAPRLLTALGSLLHEYPALRLSLYQFIVFVSLFQGFFNVSRVLLPAYVLGLGEVYVGLLQAVNSVAALVGAVLFYRLGKCNVQPLPMPMAVVSGLFMMLAAFGHDIQSSYIAYFLYIFFFELAFFKLQADLVRSTPTSAMPLMASVQYAGVYLGMIITIFAGSILVKYVGLFSTSIIFVAFYFVASNALRTTVRDQGKTTCLNNFFKENNMPTLARVFPFVRLLDLANILTMFNIGLAFGTVYFALQRRFVLAATMICLAAMLDFLDGHIARRYLAANSAQRAFGKHLDSFADLLNFSITPALVILILDQSLSATLAAVTLVFTAILRLSLFGMPGTSAGGGYQGLPTTYSGFVFALALMGLSAGHYGAGVIVGLMALVGILQVTSLRIPKYGAPSTVACFAMLFGLSTIYFHPW